MHTIHDARLALGGLGLVDGLAADQVDEHLGRYLRLGDIGRRGLAFYLCEVRGTTSVPDVRLQRARWSTRCHPPRTRRTPHARAAARGRAAARARPRRRGLLPAGDPLEQGAPAAARRDRRARAGVAGAGEGVGHPRAEARGAARDDAGDRRGTRATSLGLPEVRFPVKATLGVVPHEMLETAQKKLTAERGRPATVEEVLELALGRYLAMESKGSPWKARARHGKQGRTWSARARRGLESRAVVALPRPPPAVGSRGRRTAARTEGRRPVPGRRDRGGRRGRLAAKHLRPLRRRARRGRRRAGGRHDAPRAPPARARA